MFKTYKPIFLLGFTAFALTNCNKEQVTSDTQTAFSIPTTQGLVVVPTYYLLEGNKVNTNTAEIRQKIADLGATETAYMPDFKIMAVTSANPNFKTELEALNVNVGIDLAVVRPETQQTAAFTGSATATTNTNPNYQYQWNLQAIAAPAAWALGYKGTGVRVAVLDGGMYLNHPDLAANINQTLGRNFVPLAGENNPLDVSFIGTGFSHATHVAGVIAALDNNIGGIGVAPQAEILPVKVTSDIIGTGLSSWIAKGIVYAADNGAKVINLSIGSVWLKGSGVGASSGVPAADVAFALSLFRQAVKYADSKGATVIAAAGNDAIDFDHTGSIEVFPGASPHALCISATGPNLWYDSWLAGVSTNLDIPAFYTNFGASRIDLAAPGGNFNFTATNPNKKYDLIYSTSEADGYALAAGTSLAAPHVAAVAALIIGKNGGTMLPAHVKTKLRQSADDLGSPGNDPYFGAGRVNALKAVQ